MEELLGTLNANGEKARIVAGATDLLPELEKGLRKKVDTLVDLSRMPGMDSFLLDHDGIIHIGPLVTHNDVASSKLLRELAFPLVSASWQVGAPQIRNRGTIIGNLVTASPANDTIPPLIALKADLTLASVEGFRIVPLENFYTGVRKTVLRPNEVVTGITFPAMGQDRIGTFLKLGLRRAQAISLANTAVVLKIDGNIIISATITLGSVAPTVIHAYEAEAFLVGKTLTDEVCSLAGDLAANSTKAINDIRSSANYRKAMVKTLVKRALWQLRDGTWKSTVPETPILLSAKTLRKPKYSNNIFPGAIQTKINGIEYTFSSGFEKNLLHLLRENAGLTGTKEGCGEGECGACTIDFNGKCVMACLIPAPCADGAEITTIEGVKHPSAVDELGKTFLLHPIQQAFIDYGAVQCGYCTPGFIMAACKLLEEQSHPTKEQITQALTGNLCRCTGYYKIIESVENAVTFL
jgi:xanthine dehydrogenase iron-sulfur cluster and FAD-binding subunit A